ncbi:MAG: TetR/AcrR family transcriptional regulator [Notoacmeibacter sp.]|nr:TetR/AcrR family transcriptional regulator [Notoacmeibacter sp.]
MSEPVKRSRKRDYRSPLREAQASTTRLAILEAARSQFTAHGWKASISDIALEASVSKETVYAVFRTKRALFQELIAATVRGRDAVTPLMDQKARRIVLDEPDPHRQIAAFSQDIADVLARVAPLVDVARTASRTEPEIAELYKMIHAGRRTNLAVLAAALARNEALRPGLDEKDATAIIWRLASPELYLLVTETEGLAREDYAVWLAGMLESALLPPG